MKFQILGVVFLSLYTIECLFPYFEDFNENKALHTSRNISITVFNGLITNIILAPISVFAISRNFGLFHRYMLNDTVQFLLTLVLLDLLFYFAHILFHKVPFLWRFHRMHHSDTAMDTTTASRFHIGEHLLSILARSVMFAVMGMRPSHVVIAEIIFLANVVFHHSNMRIPEWFDGAYRLVFTSPNMHKVHHSNKVEETDTNYTAIFSIWDRIFGTYKIVENPGDITYGVSGMDDKQSILAMLKTPMESMEDKR